MYVKQKLKLWGRKWAICLNTCTSFQPPWMFGDVSIKSLLIPRQKYPKHLKKCVCFLFFSFFFFSLPHSWLQPTPQRLGSKWTLEWLTGTGIRGCSSSCLSHLLLGSSFLPYCSSSWGDSATEAIQAKTQSVINDRSDDRLWRVLWHWCRRHSYSSFRKLSQLKQEDEFHGMMKTNYVKMY